MSSTCGTSIPKGPRSSIFPIRYVSLVCFILNCTGIPNLLACWQKFTKVSSLNALCWLSVDTNAYSSLLIIDSISFNEALIGTDTPIKISPDFILCFKFSSVISVTF